MTKKTYIVTMLLIILQSVLLKATAQDYQWCVPIDGYTSTETNSNPEAFLWIPSDCNKVRGIVLSQQNMSEEPILNNIKFRKTLQELGYGIIWVAPSFDQEWNVQKGCQKLFDKMMNDFADKSGYNELKTVPIIPIGHSAMATFPWNFAAWNNDRTLAIISYHGDAPCTNLTGFGRENIEWGRTRNIDGIPGLMTEGEWEWWEARVNPALSFRMKYPESCISFLCDAGHGHFDVSDEVIEYMCMFLKKANNYRLTDNGLKKIDPKDGWLAERWNSNILNRPQTRPYSEYKGDKHDAFWYFDGDMAKATEQYYARSLGKKTQYIGYKHDSKFITYNPSNHAEIIYSPTLQEDGRTFNISAVYSDATHSKESSEHSNAKIKTRIINGPAIQINDTTFCLDLYRIGINNNRRSTDIWLQAISNGDSIYKGTAQQINIHFPFRITDGKRQTIYFESLQDIKRKTKEISLKGRSDSGLPIYYYVKYGPAHIKGNHLIIDNIPPKAKYPIEISVVAWQYGIKNKYQTAESIEHKFLIK